MSKYKTETAKYLSECFERKFWWWPGLLPLMVGYNSLWACCLTIAKQKSSSTIPYIYKTGKYSREPGMTWTKTECDFSSNQQRKGFNQIIAANAVFNIRKRGDKGRDPTTAWRLIETSAKEVITAASQSHVTHRPNVVVKSQHLLSLNLEQGTDFTGPFPKGSFQVSGTFWRRQYPKLLKNIRFRQLLKAS